MIAGSAKGRQLVRVPAGVRPVSDKAREGLFSSLGGRVEGARVLDLYAGTGALGIEALSRGAEEAVFVDRRAGGRRGARQPRPDRVQRQRSRHPRRGDPVPRALGRLPSGFDLVFLDPPYETEGDEVGAVLARLDAGSLLRTLATVALSRASRSSTM